MKQLDMFGAATAPTRHSHFNLQMIRRLNLHMLFQPSLVYVYCAFPTCGSAIREGPAGPGGLPLVESYLALGDLVVGSPEEGHPQRVHVHLEVQEITNRSWINLVPLEQRS